MATAIDREQVNRKKETVTTNAKEVTGLKVYWRDGCCSDDRSKERKIVYIPQTYLNRLSDEEQETTEIDTIIQDIVLQNQECDKAHHLMLKAISEQKQRIAKLIVDFLQIVKTREDLYNRCKEVGNKESIEAELKKLNVQLEQLSKEYNVTEEEVKKYQASIEKARTLKAKHSVATNEIDQIQNTNSVLDIKFSPTNEFSLFAKLFNNAVNEVKKIADETWKSKREEILQSARKEQKDIASAIIEHERTIEALKPKMECNERISKLSAYITKEKERLATLSEYQAQLTTVQTQYKQILNELSQTFSIFSKVYFDYVNSINSSFVSAISELEFSVRKVLRTDQLTRKISELFDNRSIGRFNAFDLKEIREDELSSEHIELFIEAILANSKDTLQLKSSYTIESALREILSDWYNIDYVVRMDNDDIQVMSPGKKALVLLRLLISLAESKCPILIDQPEDDLDNRCWSRSKTSDDGRLKMSVRSRRRRESEQKVRQCRLRFHLIVTATSVSGSPD